MKGNPAVFAIGAGGFIGGALDLTYAIGFSAYRGVAPIRILQSVASGLLGSAAFDGGMATAVLGFFLHFFNAFLFAAFFYFVSRHLEFLVRHAWISGIVYGIGIYLVMNLVVLPLSAFPRKVSFVPIVVITGLLVHMFCIGLAISLATRKAVAESL